MRIGQINLAPGMNGNGEHFIRLVESLDRQDVEQHVLVANQALASRVKIYDHVTVGPVVRTPVMAYCLMPDVDIVHAHEGAAGQAGLLMILTRSIPYVLTRRSRRPVGRNPVRRSMIRRAATIICPDAAAADALLGEDFNVTVDVVADISHETVDEYEVDNRIAAEHLRIYRRSLDSRHIPALLL